LCGRLATAAALVVFLAVGPGVVSAGPWRTPAAAQSTPPVSEEQLVAEELGAGLPTRAERRPPAAKSLKPLPHTPPRLTSRSRLTRTFGPPVAAIRSSAGFPLRC